jgi:NlpC/P60 family putative phage cell wall peptidase
MDVTRAQIVEEARRWVGTPYRHQARVRGAGCDCGGLVGGVAVALGIVAADWWEAVFDRAFGGYGRQPVRGSLRTVCDLFMARVSTPQPGDVVMMHFGPDPQHLGIVADYRHGGLSIVHALSTVGYVVEHRLAPAWRSRISNAYCYPGVV